MPEQRIQLHPEVAAALEANQPIVALESSLIARGLPHPRNLEVAQEVEQAVREAGGVPATIAILEGIIHVGLSAEELETAATPGRLSKVSRRDIPLILARRENGGTTVAATSWVAEQVGIRIFATGGIGGVHRGAVRRLDISADLPALSQTDVIVVCAGAKSVLDIGLTLEQLETWGVPVLGYQTGEFPAFYSRHSGFPVDQHVETPEEVVAVARAKWDLGLRGSVVVGVPVPTEQALDFREMEKLINRAVRDARKDGIHGRALTPYLLAAVEKATKGRSVTANEALLINNGRVAAQIARAWKGSGQTA
ncbi:MAG: pseudouridine-5'-phosphate glycosidase [Chloroflexia bacterium]|nr:pseudouridine-5'-phosphate glycosidase [Chloroflexia bacterium]